MRLKLSIFCTLTGLLVCASSALAGQARLFTGSFGGAFSTVADPYPLGDADSIAVDSSSGPSSGDVYVADAKRHRVEKFDSAGHFMLMFGGGVIAAGAEGTGDLIAGSNEVTFVTTSERTFLPSEEVTGAGIPSGTTIVSVGVGTLTLSKAATVSGTNVALSVAEGVGNVANNEQQRVTLEHNPTGGSFRLTFTSATFEGTFAEGSDQVAATHEVSGSLHVGDATAVTSAKSLGDLTAGSTSVSKVTAGHGGGLFTVGAPIEGPGIPAGTTIVAVGSETLTLSAPATLSTTQKQLNARTKVAAIDASTGSFTLSAPSISSYPGAELLTASETTTAIPYNATAGEVQGALESLAGIGVGNVAVSGGAGGPWMVEFKGALADADVSQLSVDATTLTPTTAQASTTMLVVGHSAAEVCDTDCQPGSEASTPGAFEALEGGGPFGGRLFVAVDNSAGLSSGDVYVGETTKGSEGVIAKFDEAGQLVSGWGSSGQITSSGSVPLGAVGGVTVDPSGNLWIDGTAAGNGRVFDLMQDAAFIRDWSVAGESGPLAVDSEGHVYLASGQGVERVYKYSSTGENIELISGDGGAFAFDSSSNSIFQGATSRGGVNPVLDRYEASCQGGVFVGCAPVETFTSSHFQSPQAGSGGLAVDPKGALDTIYDAHSSEVAMFSIETLPDVSTMPASGFTDTAAVLNGSINPNGVAITQCYFEWGEGEGNQYEHTAACEAPDAAEIGAGGAAVAVHAKIATQLGKAYHFRLVAANANQLYEPTVGSDVVFGPSRIDSTSVTQVTTESATFQAQVDPRNVNTEYHFEYLNEAEYAENGESFSGPHTAISVPVPDAGLGTGQADLLASQHVHGLAAHTAYRYRIVAASALAEGAEAVYGPTQSLTTWGLGQFGLPDGRSWEMVSPPNKHGALVEPIGEDWVIQAAAQGGRMAFVTRAATEPNPSGYLLYQSVLATRSPGGDWSSHDLALPHTQSTDISQGEGWEYRYFSEDLSRAIVQPFGAFVPCRNAGGESQPCLSSQATEQTAFLQGLNANAFTPLVTGAEGVADVPKGTKFGLLSTYDHECPPTLFCGPKFLYATSDAKHTLLESWTPLTESPAPGKPVPADSVYEWSEGAPPSEQLRLVSVLPGNEKGQAVPVQGVLGTNSGNIRNVLSPDGELVVFGAEQHLYLRERATKAQSALGAKGECLEAQAACTIQLDAGLTGEARFQTANANLGRVFFSDGGDLYEYDVNAGKLVRITSGAEVLETVVGASRDGSRLYFVGNGVLAPGAVPGSCSSTSTESASCNLYAARRTEGGWEAPKLVAVLGGTDDDDYFTLDLLAASVSPNGEWLAFVSHRSLTGYDNRDAASGEHDLEVYEYDAVTEALACVSCNPTGSSPHGFAYEQINTADGGVAGGHEVFYGWSAANVPTWTPNTTLGAIYQSRYLDNSGRLFFDSSDALVPKDINGTEDVYEYEPKGVPSGEHACSSAAASGSVSFRPARESEVEGRKIVESPGCVGLISSGESPQESAFLDASEGGGEVFFMTTGKLAGQDTDTSYDVYDARECSAGSPCAAPVPVSPPPCENEASCRPAPTSQPEIFGASGSATFSGPGNLVEQQALPVVKTRAKAQKLAPALKRCRKYKSRRKRAGCEASARKRARGSKGRAHR